METYKNRQTSLFIMSHWTEFKQNLTDSEEKK